MVGLKFIISLIVLTLTTLVISSSNAETTCTENSLGDQTCVTTTTTTTAGTTTGNVLTNSTFGTSGYSTSGWTTSGNIGSGHSYTTGTTYTGQNTSGGVLAFKGDPSGSIYQDVDLVGDGHLTKSQINEGFTSTMSADVWFWNSFSNTLTLKQTITDGNGTVIIQKRDITDYDPNRVMNGGQWTNYTDSAIINSNTQTDFTIRAEVYNNTAGTGWDADHYGPDVDNVQLSITTAGTNSTTTSTTFTYCYDRVPNACTYDDTALKELDTIKTSDGKTYDQYVEDAVKLDNLTIETTVLVEDDFGKIEEVKIEDYAVETFDKFISTNGLTETFETALVEENITKEEFYDTMATEIKEEFETDLGGSNELTTDTKTEDLNTDTETETTEVKEANADTTTTTETKEVSNETNTESETTETNTTKSDVAENKETEGSETKTDSKETVDAKETGDVKTNGGKTVDNSSIEKKVERVIAKVISKLKDVDKKLQAVQYITTKGITAGQADVSSYINKRIYQNQSIYGDVQFYNNLNILEQQQIYKDANLAAYISNDPIAVKQKLLQEINVEKNRLMLELKRLKNG